MLYNTLDHSLVEANIISHHLTQKAYFFKKIYHQ